MKLSRILFIIIVLAISAFSFGQNETGQLSKIDMVPHWKNDEVHTVLIKSTTTDFIKGKPRTYFTTYSANFKVLESSETGYLVE